MATEKKSHLRVVVEGADNSPARAGRASESALRLLDRALAGATNDEAIEIAYRVFDDLGRRADGVSRLAKVAAGDRDAVNEAFVFVSRANALVPHVFASADARANGAWHQVVKAEDRVKAAVRREARATLGTPTALEREADRPERPSHVVGPIAPDELLRALETAIANQTTEHLKGAATTSDVGAVMYPEHAMHRRGQASGAQAKIAQALRRLADEGRIVRLRPKWGSGSNRWTTVDRPPLGAYVAKGWVA